MKSTKNWVNCGRIGVKEEKWSVAHEVPAKYRALSQCAVPKEKRKVKGEIEFEHFKKLTN
jgi:hypothetical protein